MGITQEYQQLLDSAAKLLDNRQGKTREQLITHLVVSEAVPRRTAERALMEAARRRSALPGA